MKQNEMYAGLDPVLRNHAENVWRFCLLLVRDRAAADELCFQSFLRLGARRPKEGRSDTELLYASACRLCKDWFSRKMRKRKKADRMRELFACKQGDPLDRLIRKPMADRIAAGLRTAGLSDHEIRRIQGRLIQKRASRVSEAALAQLQSVSPPADFADQLSDRIYDRFSERSVGFENRLHTIRMRFAGLAPWLALLVLLFFGFCVWYVQNQ